MITILPEKPGSSSDQRITYAEWDIENQKMDKEAIAKADHIIHLAGENVGEKRWTKKRKKDIVDSRVKSGELLIKAMKEIPNQIKTVIAASGIGWYGPDPVIPNPDPFKKTRQPIMISWAKPACNGSNVLNTGYSNGKAPG